MAITENRFLPAKLRSAAFFGRAIGIPTGKWPPSTQIIAWTRSCRTKWDIYFIESPYFI